MAERTPDRDAWAAVVAQLIKDEAGNNTTAFAKLVGVTYKTVRRWLTKETDVSEDSIRQVASALHVKPGPLLVRAGFYSPDEIASDQTPTDADDPAMRVILEADVTPRVKQRMIQRLHDLRAKDTERQIDEVKWWINQAKEM